MCLSAYIISGMPPVSEEELQRMWTMLGEAGKDYREVLAKLERLTGQLEGRIHSPGECPLRETVEEIRRGTEYSKGVLVGVILASALASSGLTVGILKVLGG